MAVKEKIRIRLKSYDSTLVDQAAEKIVETAKRNDAAVSGPIPLPTEKEIITIINEDSQIKDPHNLRTRRIGNDFAIEIHIRLQPEMTVREAHVVATGIEDRLRAKYGSRTHVAVHVEPVKSE